jgi:hypothetical protein
MEGSVRLTIIKADNSVYIDGLALPIDCSDLPEGVEVVQWDGDRGHIEHPLHPPRMETVIDDITPFAEWINRWRSQKKNYDILIGHFQAKLVEIAQAYEDRISALEEHARASSDAMAQVLSQLSQLRADVDCHTHQTLRATG